MLPIFFFDAEVSGLNATRQTLEAWKPHFVHSVGAQRTAIFSKVLFAFILVVADVHARQYSSFGFVSSSSLPGDYASRDRFVNNRPRSDSGTMTMWQELGNVCMAICNAKHLVKFFLFCVISWHGLQRRTTAAYCP